MNPKICISTGDFRKCCIWCSLCEIKFNLTVKKIKIPSTYYGISRACVNEIILMTSLQKKKKKKKKKENVETPKIARYMLIPVHLSSILVRSLSTVKCNL